MINLKKQSLLTSLILLTSTQVQADISCTASPDCASLGYSQTAAECNGKRAIKCPFDSTKMFCQKTPVIEGCTIGSYLYTDKSCSATLDTTRTVVGIVFDPVKKLAVISNSGKISEPVNSSIVNWHRTFSSDIEYCSPATALTNCGTDGKENTKKLRYYPEISSEGALISNSSTNIITADETCIGNLVFPSTLSREIYFSYPGSGGIPLSVWYGYGHWHIASLKELYTLQNNLKSLMSFTFKKITSSTLNDANHLFTLNMGSNASGEINTISTNDPGILYPLMVINYGDTTPLTTVNIGAINTSIEHICLINNNGTAVDAFEDLYKSGHHIVANIAKCDKLYGYKPLDKCGGKLSMCCNSTDSGCTASIPVSCNSNGVNTTHYATSVTQMKQICGLQGYFVCSTSSSSYQFTCCQGAQTGCTQ